MERGREGMGGGTKAVTNAPRPGLGDNTDISPQTAGLSSGFSIIYLPRHLAGHSVCRSVGK